MQVPLPIEEPRRGLSWPRLIARGVLAGLILWTLFEFGPELRDEIYAMDAWIEAAGPLAPLVFLITASLLIPVFFPVTAMKVSAGALFGPVLGTVVCILGQLGGGVVIYGLGRYFLSDRLRLLAEDQPRLAVVRDAAEHGTAKRQFMVRMTPLSFALVSYLFAGLGVRFRPFLLGCLASVPSTIVTVGFAHAARSAAEVGEQVEGEARSLNLLTIAIAVAAMLAFAWFVRYMRAKLLNADAPSATKPS